jgi:hypothetical protein
MRARTTLLGWLRGDRGEADPVAVVAGSVVFLIASLAVAGTITLGLAASTRAQANIDLTQKVETFVANWKAKAYNAVPVVTAKATVPATDGFTGKYTVTKDSDGAYHLTVAAARQVGLNPLADCTSALTTPNGNCLVLESTIAPTPFDGLPVKPAGITPMNTNQYKDTAGNTVTVRGLFIAALDKSIIDEGAVDLRVSINAGATDTSKWNVTLTCDDLTPMAGSPDNTFIKAQNGWVSAHVLVKAATSYDWSKCGTPRLRLWNNAPAGQPTNVPAANVQIWRVAGGAQ